MCGSSEIGLIESFRLPPLPALLPIPATPKPAERQVVGVQLPALLRLSLPMRLPTPLFPAGDNEDKHPPTTTTMHLLTYHFNSLHTWTRHSSVTEGRQLSRCTRKVEKQASNDAPPKETKRTQQEEERKQWQTECDTKMADAAVALLLRFSGVPKTAKLCSAGTCVNCVATVKPIDSIYSVGAASPVRRLPHSGGAV
eukprot:GHVU01102028.1.p1 GENE.GHVU01102028.1~~GHVU01102028.1.p1  ORF type:complete len:197 (+),score=16.16 GHVU01102028.1:943-1533(+)